MPPNRMPEWKIRRLAVTAMRSAGLVVIDLIPTASNGLDEWPDVMVLGPKGRVEFIEFKTTTGVLREGQRIVLDKLQQMGFIVRVVRRWQDVTSTIDWMKNGVADAAGHEDPPGGVHCPLGADQVVHGGEGSPS